MLPAINVAYHIHCLPQMLPTINVAYCRALHCSAGRALFIHVPPLGKPYSANQLAEAIAIVLKTIVKMIEI